MPLDAFFCFARLCPGSGGRPPEIEERKMEMEISLILVAVAAIAFALIQGMDIRRIKVEDPKVAEIGSYIADGAQLAGMETGDIYTLFGNATENAIEYLQKLPDPEKRFLHLSVKRMGELVAIHRENYYEGPDRTGDAALPHTTKENKSYHGFGLRSIQMTAEKYGGEMSVHAKDHLFCLDVILPHPVAAV